MTEFEKFTEANKTSPIVEAAWVGDRPSNWNCMRIRLADKKVFTLPREDVDKIEDFPACWEKRA